MKCIKAIKETKDVALGTIKRVDDRTAINMVGNMWAYVSKSEWKKETRKSKPKEEEVEQKKKPNPKQMDGKPSNEPFIKSRKKSKL